MSMRMFFAITCLTYALAACDDASYKQAAPVDAVSVTDVGDSE